MTQRRESITGEVITAQSKDYDPFFKFPDTAVYVRQSQIDDTKGNILAFGPLTKEYSELETLGIVVALVKLLKEPDGRKIFRDIVIKYLDNMGKIIGAMQRASSQNWLTAMINQWSCTNIYARIGLITPSDQVQTKIWLDHVLGEMILKDYVTQTVGALTTLVESTSETAGKESTAGLATLAKILSGA